MPSCPLFWLPWLELERSETLQEGSQRSIGGLKGECMSVTRSQPNWTLTGHSGAAPETSFPTTINRTQSYGIYYGRMGSHPSNWVPDTCRIYAKALWSCSGGSWWPNALLRPFMLVFPLFWQFPVCLHLIYDCTFYFTFHPLTLCNLMLLYSHCVTACSALQRRTRECECPQYCIRAPLMGF